MNPGLHIPGYGLVGLPLATRDAEAIARAAKERKESRGGHFREDFPEKSEEFGKINIAIRKDENGKMEVRKISKTPLRDDLQAIINEMK